MQGEIGCLRVLLLLVLVVAGAYCHSGCTYSGLVYPVTLQRLGDYKHIKVRDLQSGPKASLSSYNQYQYRKYVFYLGLYVNCNDGYDRMTLRNTVKPGQKVYVVDGDYTTQLTFKTATNYLKYNPDGKDILHKFWSGDNFNTVVWTSENNKKMAFQGLNVVYTNFATNWRVFPILALSNTAFRSISFQAFDGTRKKSSSRSISLYKKSVDSVGTIDTKTLQQKQSGLDKFMFMTYKVYTRIDSAGVYRSKTAVVIQSGDSQYFLAPNSDEDKNPILCNRYRGSNFRSNIVYEPLKMRRFNDAQKHRKSNLTSSSVRGARFVDERFFYVERRGRGGVRLRSATDGDKYVAILRAGGDNYQLVTTDFRFGSQSDISYDFNIDIPEPDNAKQPEIPCQAQRYLSCPQPREREEIPYVARQNYFSEISPECRGRVPVTNIGQPRPIIDRPTTQRPSRQNINHAINQLPSRRNINHATNQRPFRQNINHVTNQLPSQRNGGRISRFRQPTILDA